MNPAWPLPHPIFLPEIHLGSISIPKTFLDTRPPPPTTTTTTTRAAATFSHTWRCSGGHAVKVQKQFQERITRTLVELMGYNNIFQWMAFDWRHSVQSVQVTPDLIYGMTNVSKTKFDGNKQMNWIKTEILNSEFIGPLSHLYPVRYAYKGWITYYFQLRIWVWKSKFYFTGLPVIILSTLASINSRYFKVMGSKLVCPTEWKFLNNWKMGLIEFLSFRFLMGHSWPIFPLVSSFLSI